MFSGKCETSLCGFFGKQAAVLSLNSLIDATFDQTVSYFLIMNSDLNWDM